MFRSRFLVLLLLLPLVAAAPFSLEVPRGGGWLTDTVNTRNIKSKLVNKKDRLLKDAKGKANDIKKDVTRVAEKVKKDAQATGSKQLDGTITKTIDSLKKQIDSEKKDATKRLEAERKKTIDFLKKQIETDKKDATKRLKAERKKLMDKAGKEQIKLQKKIEDLNLKRSSK
jgi:F0F1-type ATP synthase membrane subunit b/b'